MSVKIIPFTNSIGIDENDNFYTVSDNDARLFYPQVVFGQHGTLVTLMFNGQIRTIGLGWLKYLAMTEYNLQNDPLELITNFTQCRYLDRDWFIPVFRYPVYADTAMNFRVVPGFYSVSVNKHGVVSSMITSLPINKDPRITKINKVIIYDPLNNKNSRIPVSLLVALAWLPNEHPAVFTGIKHLDGNEYNCSSNNLEWIFENNAGNKLTAEAINIEFRVRDVYTNKIIEFSDVESTLKFLDLPTTPTYRNMLYNNRWNQLFNKKYEVRSSADPRPWFYVDNRTPENTSSTSKLLFSIIDKDTSKETIVSGGRALAKAYDIGDSHMATDRMIGLIHDKYPNLKVKVIDTTLKSNTVLK